MNLEEWQEVENHVDAHFNDRRFFRDQIKLLMYKCDWAKADISEEEWAKAKDHFLNDERAQLQIWLQRHTVAINRARQRGVL